MADETVTGLDGMERGASGMLRAVTEAKRLVRAGETMTPADVVRFLELGEDALRRTLEMVGTFRIISRQARQAAEMLTAGSALNRQLLDQLGSATLQTESALGLVPQPGRRN